MCKDQFLRWKIETRVQKLSFSHRGQCHSYFCGNWILVFALGIQELNFDGKSSNEHINIGSKKSKHPDYRPGGAKAAATVVLKEGGSPSEGRRGNGCELE